MITAQDGQLHVEALPLPVLAERFGTPLFVYSHAVLSERARRIRQAVLAHSADSLICYAVKANGNVHLLRLLRQLGLGADVTGGGELFLAREAGFSPANVLFSGVGKSAEEIEAALEWGIRSLHVESEAEFELIQRLAAARDRVAPVAIRVNPDIAAETHPHISTGRSSHKFGVPPETALHLLHRAASDPWLRPVGLAAHIGSQIVDLPPFHAAAAQLVQLAECLRSAGIRLEYLDVGGGFGIDYTNFRGGGGPDPVGWVDAVASAVCTAGYGLVLEPGRSVVGPAGLLLTQVRYAKEQGDRRFVIVDAAMTELLRPALYGAHHPIVPVTPSRGATQPAEVVGPVCETGDTLGHAVPLPPLKTGDLLAIGQAGAYGFAMSSNYNGRPRAAEVLVDGDQVHLIRRRQGYEALLDGTML